MYAPALVLMLDHDVQASFVPVAGCLLKHIAYVFVAQEQVGHGAACWHFAKFFLHVVHVSHSQGVVVSANVLQGGIVVFEEYGETVVAIAARELEAIVGKLHERQGEYALLDSLFAMGEAEARHRHDDSDVEAALCALWREYACYGTACAKRSLVDGINALQLFASHHLDFAMRPMELEGYLIVVVVDDFNKFGC